MKPIILHKQVSPELCKFVSQEMRILEGVIEEFNPEGKYEPGFEDSFNAYCPPCLEALSLTIRPIIEKQVGKQLLPSYTYGRIYRPGAKLDKHYDRRSSEVSVSVCLEKGNTPWFLSVETEEDKVSVDLDVGDILIYCGRDFAHWREGPYRGDEQIQVFIQYVDKNGDSADLVYDGRPKLGLPFGYKSDFVKEELNDQLSLRDIS